MARLMQADAPQGELFYVSPTGSDGNPGTPAQPWLTLAHAQTAVRALAGSMHGPITVVLRGGTYALTSTLAFTSADAGTNGYPVTWQAYPGETPVISGGIPITGWTLHDSGKNIWQASVPTGADFRQLYAGETRVQRAWIACPSLGATNSTGYSTTALNGYAIPADLEIVYRASWAEQRIAVSSVSGGTVTMIQPAWANFLANITWGASPVYLEGAYEILTAQAAPQTFYLNKATNTAYYIPAAGVDPNTLAITAPQVEQLVTCTSTGSGGLVFNGLTFAHTSWLQAHTTYGFVEYGTDYIGASFDLTHRVGSLPSGAVWLNNSPGAAVRGCCFTHIGNAGLAINGLAAAGLIEGCIFADISAEGIILSDPTEYSATTPTHGIRVENNVIHDIGLEYRGASGIVTCYAASSLIRRNRVYNCPYQGILIGWGQGQAGTLPNGAGNNEIAYNDVGPCMQVQNDGAAIYANGPQTGTTIHHNACHDIQQASQSAGLYLDDGTENVSLHDNYIWSAASHAINVNDTIGGNTITATYSDNSTVSASSGPLNGYGGAAADSIASPIAVSTQAAQAWAAFAGAGLSPQFAYLSTLD